MNQPPFKKFGASMKKMENLNYALDIAKSACALPLLPIQQQRRKLNFSVVGVEGKDIYDGNKVLTLGIVWQLMRAYTLSLLEKLSGASGTIGDAQILDFVNSTVQPPLP